MRGQYLTVEYMFYFAIGIAMIVAVYSIFSNTLDIYKKQSMQSQIQGVGELVREAVVYTYSATSMAGGSLEQTIRIPGQVSGCSYKLEVDNDNLKVSCPGANSTLSMFGLKVVDTTLGNLISSRQFLKVWSDGTSIELR